MQKIPQLKLSWATWDAASYACKNWHYSKQTPTNKSMKIGVWEDDKFIGVIMYGCGACPHFYKGYGIKQEEACELTRIALRPHYHPVSKMIAISLRLLLKENPKLLLISSYADTSQNHHGGIYQATNWIYTGISDKTREHFLQGRWRHATSIRRKFKKSFSDTLPMRIVDGKYRYLMPVNSELRKKILELALPYPKREKQAMAIPIEQRQGGTDLHAPLLSEAVSA